MPYEDGEGGEEEEDTLGVSKNILQLILNFFIIIFRLGIHWRKKFATRTSR